MALPTETCTPTQVAGFASLLKDYLPIFITAVVAFIGWKQHRIEREKVRLSLYEKRYAIYEVTVAFAASAMNQQANYALQQDAFMAKYREAQFLFRSEDGIYELLETIRHDALFSSAWSEDVLRNSRSPEEFAEIAPKIAQRRNGLAAHVVELEKRIAPYLEFKRFDSRWR